MNDTTWKELGDKSLYTDTVFVGSSPVERPLKKTTRNINENNKTVKIER
jgi:hypothetical protein